MKWFKKIMCLAGFFILLHFQSYSQTILTPRDQTFENEVFISFGFEPELVGTIGYTHLSGTSGKKIDVHIGASVKVGLLDISNDAWRANLIGAIDYRMSDDWGTKFTTSLYNAHDHNRAGIIDGLGFECRATPVHYGKKWIKGFDIGWQYTALTHIKHSAEARDTFNERYPNQLPDTDGPNNGWFSGTASRFRLGIVGSTRLDNHLRLLFGVGGLINIQKQDILIGFSHAQFPFYLESMLSYTW